MKILSVILVCLFVFVSGCQAKDNSGGDFWKAEFRNLQHWRDKNHLPFSDKKLEEVAKYLHDQISGWRSRSINTGSAES